MYMYSPQELYFDQGHTCISHKLLLTNSQVWSFLFLIQFIHEVKIVINGNIVKNMFSVSVEFSILNLLASYHECAEADKGQSQNIF